MRIMTIGASPYLLAKNGRIHRDVLLTFENAEASVLDHDASYFLPDKAGIYEYQKHRIYPFSGVKGEEANFLLRTMMKVQPDLVISIGDYTEITALSIIKAKYPDLFRWVALITTGSSIINEKYRERLNIADAILCTTASTSKSLEKLLAIDVFHIPYGPSHDDFFDLGIEREGFLTVVKNSQMSNVPAFMQAMQGTSFKGYIHFNCNDSGDYDIPLLLERYGLEETVKVPSNYVSVREGISDVLMNELYNSHGFFVDCSLRSGTALSLLEAMATGCLPIGMDFGAVGEVIRLLPEKFRMFVDFQTYLGPNQEDMAIISSKGLNKVLKNAQYRWCDEGWRKEAMASAKAVASIFSKDIFTERVKSTVGIIAHSEHAIVVDSF